MTAAAPNLLGVVNEELPTEIVLDGGSAGPVMEVPVLILKLALIGLEDRVVPSLLLNQPQQLLVIFLLVGVRAILLRPRRVCRDDVIMMSC